jgi:hypothetical protein
MPRALILRLFLVCAVLLAQQTALAHDFWHATAQQPAGEAQKLCDLHDLLGTVLGVVSIAIFAHDLSAFDDVGFRAVDASTACHRPLSPHSRDPPLSS